MGNFKWVALVLGGIALVGCGSDDSSKTYSSASELCTDICAKGPPLKCTNESDAATCKSDCTNSLGMYFDKCKSQVNAFANCGLSKGASDYECDADGEANLKDGVCSTEINAVVSCASK